MPDLTVKNKKSFLGLPWHMLPTIFALAWPTMLEQLLSTLVQYVDTAMVGSLGTTATAAVGSTTTVNWLVGSTVSAVGVGFLAFVSQSLGRGDRQSARRAASQAVLSVIAVGSLFTVITLLLSPAVPVLMQVDESARELASKYFFILYVPLLARCATIIFGTLLRAAGDTKTPMLVGIIVNTVNVVLNFLLIYESRYIEIFGIELFIPGAGLGVIGAAVASAVSFIVGGVLITAALFRHPLLSPKGQSIKPDRAILIPCLKVAIPNALQRFATSLGYVVFAATVNSLGEVSTAAHTVANTVESAFYIPGYGMQTAAATLAGGAYGAKDKKKLSELSKMAIFIEIVLMIISGGLLFISAPFMVSLFSRDTAVILLCTTVLRMVALSEPFYGFSIIVEGMMQGMGRTLLPFVTNVVGMWIIRIVGTFISVSCFGADLTAAWGFMILHNLALFTVYLILFTTGRWSPMRNITEEASNPQGQKSIL